MTGQSSAQEQVPGGHVARGQLLELTHKESSLLVVVPASSQDLGAELLLQMDLSTLDISAWLRAGSTASNATDIMTQDLDPKPMPSMSWEGLPPQSSTPWPTAKQAGPGTLFHTLLPWMFQNHSF